MTCFIGLNVHLAMLLVLLLLRYEFIFFFMCLSAFLKHVYLAHAHIYLNPLCIYVNRHRDVTASSKFQALTDLLQQLGFVASETSLLQQKQEQLSGCVRGTKRRRFNEVAAEPRGAEAEVENEEEDDDEGNGDEKSANRDTEDDSEEGKSAEKHNATPPQKFILFAQNR